MARILACCSRISSTFVGGLEWSEGRIPLLKALSANPDDVDEVDLVFVPLVELLAVVDFLDSFFFPILLKFARFSCVSRARLG